VPRAQNAHADRLANVAMDEAAGASNQPSRSGRRSDRQVEAPVASPQSPIESAASAIRNLSSASPIRNPQSEIRNSPTSAERAVRLFIYRHFVETARAPDPATIARATRLDSDRVVNALRRLADLHAIVLAPASTSIWMAHPFSAVPTGYPVDVNTRTYWANCAWDAAGILAMIGGDGESRTRCADCGTEIEIAVRNGELASGGVVHYAVPPRRFWDNVAYT
jgi:hypothetical protein